LLPAPLPPPPHQESIRSHRALLASVLHSRPVSHGVSGSGGDGVSGGVGGGGASVFSAPQTPSVPSTPAGPWSPGMAPSSVSPPQRAGPGALKLPGPARPPSALLRPDDATTASTSTPYASSVSVSPRGDAHRMWNRDKDKARLSTIASPLLRLYVLARGWLASGLPRTRTSEGEGQGQGQVGGSSSSSSATYMRHALELMGLSALAAGEMCLHDMSPVSHRLVVRGDAFPLCK
jgi:hypothetical protein